jgi:flagellar biosynthesis/type III secretory pathway protein FliH
MDEKQPAFTVTDRRKFTLEGERRDESSEPAEERAPEEPVGQEKVVTMPASPEPETAAEPEPPEEPELQQFTARETAEQNEAYQESSRQIDDMLRQGNPEMGPAGAITFEHIIQSFYVSAMIAMGAGAEPGQKARIDILGARQSIDMLALLQEKTKGNLTEREQATLQNVLFELRMMFLEITNAIAQSAQRPADGKK